MTASSRSRAAPDHTTLFGSPRHALRRSVMVHPSLYLPLARWKRRDSTLGDRTQLVLDGFERTANTFAVVAFQYAQNGHVRVAHHMHAVAPFVEAVRRRLPTIVTVREPGPTIVSAMLRQPSVTARQWLKTYIAFYEGLLPLRSGCVVAPFDEVTTSFGSVIRRTNARFGTRFLAFEHTEENVAAVFALIEERAAGEPWASHANRFLSGEASLDEYVAATEAFGDRSFTSPEHRVARPSSHRASATREMREIYQAPPLTRLRERAEAAYDLLTT